MILTGKDAKKFLEEMNAAVMTPERLKYLQECAEQSKKAEDFGLQVLVATFLPFKE